MNQAELPTLIYDGHCPFCRKQVENLRRMVGPVFHQESFHEDGVLAKYPGLTHEECMKEIKLSLSQENLLGGAAAIFYVMQTKWYFKPLWWGYQIPGIKHLMDWGYNQVAKNRYRIRKEDCADGSCSLYEK